MRRNTTGGILALLGIVGFVLYRNREKVRETLDRQGIHVPHRDELISRLRSTTDQFIASADRIINRVKEDVPEVQDELKKQLKEVG